MANKDNERSRVRIVLDFLRRLLGKKPPPIPGDPYAYCMAPVHRGPNSRSSAAAAEPETLMACFLPGGYRRTGAP
ncbi:MAG: hypothetical protein WBV55_19005 [Candidatus Sulfotelmatobacter sp.]